MGYSFHLPASLPFHVDASLLFHLDASLSFGCFSLFLFSWFPVVSFEFFPILLFSPRLKSWLPVERNMRKCVQLTISSILILNETDTPLKLLLKYSWRINVTRKTGEKSQGKKGFSWLKPTGCPTSSAQPKTRSTSIQFSSQSQRQFWKRLRLKPEESGKERCTSTTTEGTKGQLLGKATAQGQAAVVNL